MAKVNVTQAPVVIPAEYVSTKKPICSSWEQVIQVQPLQTAFTVPNGSSTFKVVVPMPNYNFRLSEMYIELQLQVNFTSDDVKDTYAAVQPTLTQWATSLINQVRFLSGSTLMCDYRQVNLRYAWCQNLYTNSINDNPETYNNVTPAPWTASGEWRYFRFPLTCFPNDFFSLGRGIFPGSYTKPCNLELYFEVPSVCLYAAGAIEGNLTFSYQIQNLNVQIVYVMDPNLDRRLQSSGCMISWMEPYHYSQSITTSKNQSILIPTAFQSVRCILYGIRLVSALTSQTSGTKMTLMSSELTELVRLNLKINSQYRQQIPFQGGHEVGSRNDSVLPDCGVRRLLHEPHYQQHHEGTRRDPGGALLPDQLQLRGRQSASDQQHVLGVRTHQ